MWKCKGIWTKALKQYPANKKIGGFKDIALHTAAWLSFVNFGLIAVTAYHTTLREFILAYIPWMSLIIFMLLLSLCVAIFMVIEYKFIIPSTWAFRNAQQYEHKYPIKKDLEKLSKKLDELEKLIKKEGKDNGRASQD